MCISYDTVATSYPLSVRALYTVISPLARTSQWFIAGCDGSVIIVIGKEREDERKQSATSVLERKSDSCGDA